MNYQLISNICVPGEHGKQYLWVALATRSFISPIPTHQLATSKSPPTPSQRELVTAEKERLDWLQGRLPVPSIYAFCSASAHTYLLTSEISGLLACDLAFAKDIPA